MKAQKYFAKTSPKVSRPNYRKFLGEEWEAAMDAELEPIASAKPFLLGATAMWVENPGLVADSNVLITVSDSTGEHSYLLAGEKILETKASLFVQAPVERIATGARAVSTRLSTFFRWSGYLVATVLLTFSVFSFSGTVKARVVLTGSMVPAINPGDIILTTPTKNLTPKVGTIVAYVGRRFDGSAVGVFSHRIIGGDAETGFIVKGDANPSPDVQHPKIPDITGVVFFVIPVIGKFLTPRALLVTVPLIFGLWMVIDALKND